MHDRYRLKDHIKENQLYLNRAICAVIIILVGFFILIGRIFYLQIIKHDLYVTLAKKNQVRMIPLPPARGLIYDRNGVLLAENVPSFSLTVIPSQSKDLSETIAKIKNIININDDQLDSFYKQIKYRGLHEATPLKTKLTEEEVAKISLNKYQFTGVDISASLSRVYKFKEPISHVVGYIGPISDNDLSSIDISEYRNIHEIGKLGVEKYYQEELKGKIGFRHVETNSKGRILRSLKEDPAIPGKNLYLSLDIKLQRLLYSQIGDKKGAVVAIDPSSGEVLAIASTPGFDPNYFVQGISQKQYDLLSKDKNKPLFNRAIKGRYPPGSTVKPIIALRALDDGIISQHSKIFDPGFYQINSNGRKFRCWNHAGHGNVNISRALGESCGTFFYQLANSLGIDKLHQTFTSFNLGRKTNIDIYGEDEGLVPSRKWKQKHKKSAWYIGETLNVGVGQGYTQTTPLQVAVMTSIIANRGTVIKPSILRKELEGNLTNNNEDIKIPINDANNWDIVISGMEKATKHKRGTAFKYFYNFPFSIAGKTGTAQVYSLAEGELYEKDKVSKNLRDHSWFIGFAPVHKPKIAVAAIIENDSGAAKITRDIMEYYLINQTAN